MSYLKHFIREVLLLEKAKQQIQLSDDDVKMMPAPPQAPASELLGKYAFPEERKEAEPDIPDEPDTSYETELLDAINSHLGGKNIPLSPEHTDNIKRFMKSKYYKKVFHPGPDQTYYRGEAATPERLKELLGTNLIPETSGVKKVDFVWKPRKGENYGSSWTVDKQVAISFTERETSREKPWKVILVTEQRENFVSCIPKGREKGLLGLYRVAKQGINTEHEVISLGPVKVSSIEWEIDEMYMK